MELSAEKKRTAFPRIFSMQFFLLICFFLALVPLLSSGENHLTGRSKVMPISIPYPAFSLIIALFVPVFLGDCMKTKGRRILDVFGHTTRITLPIGILSLVVILYALHPNAYWDKGIELIITDVYNWVLIMLCIAIATSRTIRSHYRKIFTWALVVMALGIIWNLISPETFDTGRTNRPVGFGGNPNRMAVSFLFVLVGAIDWYRSRWGNVLVLTLSGFSIYITLSVGGLAMYAFILGAYLVVVIMKNQPMAKKLMVLISVVLIMVLSSLVMKKVIRSYDLFSTYSVNKRVGDIADLLSGDFRFFLEHSRTQLMEDFYDKVMEAPLLGHGTGYSENFPTGTHNMFLRYWLENGLLGLLFYSLFIVGGIIHFYRLKDTRGLIFMMVTIIESFHTQNLLEYKSFIVMLGFLCALGYLERSEQLRRVGPMTSQNKSWV